MTIVLNPYLSFDGNAREAMEFYRSVFGGELNIGTFADFQASQNETDGELVMHSSLTTPDGLTLMASDTAGHVEYRPGGNITVSLNGSSEDEKTLTEYWTKLMEGGVETAPLSKAVWGDSFGMGTDRFGIGWLINISASAS